ncbi:hypothetical protein ABZP36_019686 [Zizania latifolia]
MGAASSAPPLTTEVATPADPPAKEEPQRGAVAAVAASAGDAGGGGGGGAGSAEETGETVIVDVAAEAAEGEAAAEEEEEGECGFCLFMKGGGCKEEFVDWEKCVEEAEEAGGDIVERCYEATAALRKCMDAHAEYYEPILRAERVMAEDLEAAKVREASGTSSQPAPSLEEEAAGEKQAVAPEK